METFGAKVWNLARTYLQMVGFVFKGIRRPEYRFIPEEICPPKTDASAKQKRLRYATYLIRLMPRVMRSPISKHLFEIFFWNTRARLKPFKHVFATKGVWMRNFKNENTDVVPLR